ncbi:complement C3-like [Trichomycterus rosablanca]|uniref:complement C3-like n=1 Tax=Trichomycterus rosablanca TaxID=2290929 RepID=UPI002F35EA37
MYVDVVWVAVTLLSFPVLALCDPLNVMIAPNLLRVGTPEKVFVEVQDQVGNGNVPVKISVKNYPRKIRELASVSVVLTQANNYQELVSIKIPDDKDFFTDDPLEKQYVYVLAEFPSSQLEKVVMVSFQSGYIFIQTDKSIYTPNTDVKYRLFSLTPDLQPIQKSLALIEILNNQGIPIHSETKSIEETTTGMFKIPEVASPGIWSVVARYKNTPQKNFTAEFEVKEYVLPSFEVTLTPSKSFFYVDDGELEVTINARYLFGENVEGVAYVVFGVIQDGAKISLPAALSRVLIHKGEGKATLTREMIQQTFDINTLVGDSLYISVSVLTQSGSEMVEGQKNGIPIVTSPYTIHFKHTPQYFKPGMSFDVMVYVTNPDQTPAKHVDVVVSPGEVRGRTKSNGIAKVVINTLPGISTFTITAKTDDPDILKTRQAQSQMTARAYATKGGSSNYIHISIDKTELQVNDPMTFNLQFGQSKVKKQDFTYLLLSKGQIIMVERFKGEGQSLISKSIVVTKDLVPSFRLVAYYHVGADEVVADSTWVDVMDTCMGTLKLTVKDKNQKPSSNFEPSEEFKLDVTGDPGAKVGLVAVDKAVFVLNKNRLTQTKVWDIIEKHDTGCTVGSGKDSMGVFFDAGLMFESDKAGGTQSRTDLKCPSPPKRKRRAQSLLQMTQTLSGKYSGEIKKCCIDGMKQNKLGYSCEQRATYITDGAECVQAFLQCCKEMEKNKKKQENTELMLARTEEDDDDFLSEDEITTRTQFPESWLWEDITLPTCKGKCETTSLTMNKNYMKDSITTWQLLAISLSKTHSICVADPLEVVVSKSFFVDLRLPYSAVRNEQIEIKAILHNYSRKKQRVKVNFLETPNICSGASKKGKYTTIVYVDSMSTRAVPYVIIPMEIDEFTIEVQAMTPEFVDGVRKTLKVVAEGELVEKVVLNEELNPSKAAGGIQRVEVRGSEPDGRIPKTPANTYIIVSGQEISQTIEQAISGDFMGRLIVQPHGCGEQNMIFMTLPLIATHYLDSTNQWEFVGMQRRSEAVKHIKTGYDQELAYRKPDGSYGAWIHHPSSTWLTAYVAKVFALASDIIAVQDDVLCSALKWLILIGQMPDGMFKDSAPVIHGEMVGDVRGKDADASLTAFVLIAMQEGSSLCEKSVASLPGSMKKATDYLERRLPTLTNPYAIAMTSYAMANAGKFNRDLLMRHSSEDGTYWRVAGQPHFSLEATAYALLALVRAKDFEGAGKAVKWLNRQSTHYGGSGTTQATIMVFQAVAEYYKKARSSQNVDLNVEVFVSERSKPTKWSITRSDMHLTRSDKVSLKDNFNLTAQGSGMGFIKVVTLYYARPLDNPGDCKAFDLSVRMEKQPLEKEEEKYLVTIEFVYKKERRDATMSILDIGLLTGFVVDKEDLKLLTTGKDKYVQKLEMDKQLSEKGSLILYLDKVSHKMQERIVFSMTRETKVSYLQPAAVSLYEYYSPERCVKYYHPEKIDGALSRLCADQEGLCQCAEENCSYQKKNKINDDERETKACEAGMDYVYKVQVMGINNTAFTSFYYMKILEVLKEGSDANVRGQVRRFIGNTNCIESFGFEEGKTYLIMGRSDDLPMVDRKLQYILGEQTWIEYWPTRQEGQIPEYEDRYVGISSLAQTLTDFGCTS